MQNLKSSKMIFSLCMVFCAMELIQAVTMPLVGKDLKFALDYHNELRKGEKASNMMKLKWSNTLAKEAGAWAKTCNFEHQMKGRGENLAFDSNPGSLHERIKTAMDAWFSEKKDFSWAASSCYTSCHYTQIVWANTTEVGCSMEKCAYLNAFGRSVKNAFYYVCFYNPMGNFGNHIYTPGSPCSKCPAGAKCEDGLCVGGSDGGDEAGACKDSYNADNCKDWAARNECKKNPDWMLVNCKKSCKAC